MSCLVFSSEAFCRDLSKQDESLAFESSLAFFFSQKTESESSLKYGIHLANDRILHNFILIYQTDQSIVLGQLLKIDPQQPFCFGQC